MNKQYKTDEAATYIDLVETMFCTIILFAILMIGFDYLKIQNAYIEANEISRTYMHALEVEGYLTSELQTGLITELKEEGIVNVSFVGTTMNAPEHGEDIKLIISGTLSDELNLKFLTSGKAIVIEKNSIFKN